MIRTEEDVQTVSELASALNAHLREFGDGWVEGEVQKWFVSGRGHVFFTVADEDAVLDCRIWSSDAPPAEHHPGPGQLIKARFVRPELWPAKGRFQLSVDRVEATGEGELLRRAAEVLKRLERDGLTRPERKRELPPFARQVGIIAGNDSDAQADVVAHLRERFRPIDIVTCPATVEGQRAVPEIIDALGRLSRQPRVDVIVIARGGGSVTDLFPFSDERLCRAIAACGVPVVTSIGHTKQRPNCDHVAAACAHVPAKTAELVVPSAVDVAAELGRIEDQLDAAPGRVADLREEISNLVDRFDPHGRLQGLRGEVEASARELILRANGFYGERRAEIDRWLDGLGRIRDRAARAQERVEETATRIEGARGHVYKRYADYRTAVKRHEDEARKALVRRIGRERELVEDRRQRLRSAAEHRFALERERTEGMLERMPAAARRAIERARQAVEGLSAVIRAHDFRERGWILASTERGPVRSVDDLRPGDRLDLRLHDGRASAGVEEIDPENKETDDG